MASIWVESVGRGLDQALDLLAAAVRDCTDDLWETAMWEVPAPHPDRAILGVDEQPVTDPAARNELVQRHATPWGVAWHALECFDYDLNGEFGPWAPPPPFTGHPHWRDLTNLPAAWSRSEMLGYIDYCRQQARNALADMTEEQAATPLPPTHRYRGQPHARIITGMVGHTTEHASQIRQFITAAGIAPAV
ncbi:MAG: DinB family protein [Dehalococcoidia bacterium]